jgi:hypothetical protein
MLNVCGHGIRDSFRASLPTHPRSRISINATMIACSLRAYMGLTKDSRKKGVGRELSGPDPSHGSET